MRVIYLSFIGCLFFLTSCKSSVSEKEITRIDSSFVPKYAVGFRIDYLNNGNKIISIFEKDTTQLLLCSNGEKDESSYSIPLKKVACLSTPVLEMLNMLGELHSVKAVDNGDWIYNQKVLDRIAQNEVVEIGSEYQMNKEALLIHGIEAVFAYTSPSGGKELDARVNINEYLEKHPLGRTEWLILLSAFYNKETEAKNLFSEIEQKYLAIKSQAKYSGKKILLGTNYDGTWYIPGKDSYLSRLVLDAGGELVFPEIEGVGTTPISLESVIAKGDDVDVWMFSEPKWNTKNEMLNSKIIYNQLLAVRSNELYNAIKRQNAHKANDFWESGVVHPEWLLQDISTVLRGGEDELIFYNRLF